MPKLPTQRAMRANIRRDLAAALAAGLGGERHWYRAHAQALAAFADDQGIERSTVATMAANVSPGLDPEREIDYLAWVIDTVLHGTVPGPENRPHGYGTPRGYAPMVRASESLLGTRERPPLTCKTGNYATLCEDPEHPEAIAHDVHAHRTACGDPIGVTSRKLPSLTPTEYAEVKRAWLAVADANGMLPSEVQAICWVYRRGRA